MQNGKNQHPAKEEDESRITFTLQKSVTAFLL
jgi:hypothetical protein